MITAFAISVLVLATATLGVVAFNVFGWRRLTREAACGAVSVLIPARNEADNLPACLAAVLAQPEAAEVIVADDHSTDGTADVVRDCSDSRVKLTTPPALPPGWCGKNNACHHLGSQARGEWLLFIDADARLADGAIGRMLAEAKRRDLTFLSCWPQLEMRGFFEKLLMPLLNFVLLTLYPAPLAARRHDAPLGLAHGACILMRADVYRAIGGHEAVKAELFEDTRLARLWRERGHRGLCLDGTGVVCVRMYDSLGGIWAGFRKNLFPAFQGHTGFAAFMALHALVFFAPFVLWPLHPLLIAAAGCVLLSRVLLALRFGHPLWAALLHPFGQAILLLIGAASWLRVVTGRGVDWKGRTYRVAGEAA